VLEFGIQKSSCFSDSETTIKLETKEMAWSHHYGNEVLLIRKLLEK